MKRFIARLFLQEIPLNYFPNNGIFTLSMFPDHVTSVCHTCMILIKSLIIFKCKCFFVVLSKMNFLDNLVVELQGKSHQQHLCIFAYMH